MRWCRIRLVLLGLLLCVVHVVSGTCGQNFTDPASSAILADVVIEGKVRKVSDPRPDGTFDISASIRKSVLKGAELVNNGEKAKRITIDKFKEGEEDGDKCIGSVELGRTYFFFLKDISDPKGLHFEIMALPIKKSKKHAREIRKILCNRCAKAPSIRRLQGPDVSGVSEGSKVTLKCAAKAKPNPVFKWYKDGVLLKDSRGVRIKNGKRQSKLQIRKASQNDAGEYECVASNAVGEARKFHTVNVKSARQAIPCETQTFCLNGGKCMHSPAVDITFCECPRRFQGLRCEVESERDIIRPIGQATLMYERTLIIVGIVIAVLVFIIICIASYFLAKKRRERFEERRKRREERREQSRPSDALTRRDPQSRQPTESANRHDNASSNYAPRQIGQIVLQDPPPPRAHRTSHGNVNESQRHPAPTQRQEQQQPLLQAENKPDPLGDRPESRRRLVASSMYENCDEAKPAEFTDCTDFHKNVTTAAVHPESYEMTQLGETDHDNKEPDHSQAGPPYANLNNGSSTNNKLSPPPPPMSSESPPPSIPPPPYHQVIETIPPSSESTFISLQPQPPSSPSSPSTPSLTPHNFPDDNSSRVEADTAAQPLLPKHERHFHHYDQQPNHRLFESKSDKDLSRHLPSGSKRQDANESPGYDSDSHENDRLLKNRPKVSHSNTFPKTKINGKAPDSCSDSDEDEEDEEVPYKRQSDLHISEEDLDLSKENLVSASFSSVAAPPSRQASREEPVMGLLQNSSPSRPEMRKYLSEEGPAYNILANKKHSYQLQDYARSHSLDDPPTSGISNTGANPRRLNSTLAGSPDVETYDNIDGSALGLQNHDYAYDPNEDSTPWDGEVNKSYSNLTEEERDRLNRLKDVVPDQQAIPI